MKDVSLNSVFKIRVMYQLRIVSAEIDRKSKMRVACIDVYSV